MRKNWAKLTDLTLIAYHSAIVWGLENQAHVRLRFYRMNSLPLTTKRPALSATQGQPGEGNGRWHIAPTLIDDLQWRAVKQEMEEARDAIRKLLDKRKQGRPEIEFIIITNDQMDLMEIGWKTYSDLHRIGFGYGRKRP